MINSVSVYYWDLSLERRKELLEAFGVKGPCEMNWDVSPVAVVEHEGSEQHEARHGSRIVDESDDGLVVENNGKRFEVKAETMRKGRR